MPICCLLSDQLKTRIALAPSSWVRYINLLEICIGMRGETAPENTVRTENTSAVKRTSQDEHLRLGVV